jgi:hypothetical protein
MSSYKLADFLFQEIPDHLMLDIALHFQANDNRCASQQSRQWDISFDPPPHRPDKVMARPGRSNVDPRWLPQGCKPWDIGEGFVALWDWCRIAVTSSREDAASCMAETFLIGDLVRQPG